MKTSATPFSRVRLDVQPRFRARRVHPIRPPEPVLTGRWRRRRIDAVAVPLLADLHEQLPVTRPFLQDAIAVSADPHVVFEIDKAAVRGIGHDGVAARLGQSGVAPAVHEDAGRVELEDGRGGDRLGAVSRGDATALEPARNDEQVVTRVDAAPGDVAGHPLLRLAGGVFRRRQRSGPGGVDGVPRSASLPLCQALAPMDATPSSRRTWSRPGRTRRCLSVMRPPTFIQSNRGTRGARRNDFGSACSAVSCSKYRFRSSPYAAPLRRACPGPPAARDRSAAS